jgi:hypothetical protein
MLIRIQGFDDQKLEKNYCKKFFENLKKKKYNFPISNFQATEEAFGSQKITSSTSKHEDS